MTQSLGIRRPLEIKPSMNDFHASFDSAAQNSSANSRLLPSFNTAIAARTGNRLTLPALRMGNAMPSKKTYATSRLRKEHIFHASHCSLSVAKTRETALFDSGA